MPGSHCRRARISSQADAEHIRREARNLAGQLAFARHDAEAVGLAVSELATNLVRYASEGEIELALVSEDGRQGILVVSRDAGPGIEDVEKAMEDGFSTGGGLGSGLPAARRLMDSFRIVSSPAGTRIEARKWAHPQSPSR